MTGFDTYQDHACVEQNLSTEGIYLIPLIRLIGMLHQANVRGHLYLVDGGACGHASSARVIPLGCPEG